MDTLVLLGALALCLGALYAVVRSSLMLPSSPFQRVTSTVIGHSTSASSGEDGEISVYAAIYAFHFDGRDYQVTDGISRNKPTPPQGSEVLLTFPPGRPDKAQPPRTLLWTVFALILAGFCVAIIAKLLGLV